MTTIGVLLLVGIGWTATVLAVWALLAANPDPQRRAQP